MRVIRDRPFLANAELNLIIHRHPGVSNPPLLPQTCLPACLLPKSAFHREDKALPNPMPRSLHLLAMLHSHWVKR